MIVTVYRKPVLERQRDPVTGRLLQRESSWRRTKMLEARDLKVLAVYWPRVHLDFGGLDSAREFSLNTGRGLNLMRDWVLKPEDCRALRQEHAPKNRRKRRELARDETGKEYLRPGRL